MGMFDDALGKAGSMLGGQSGDAAGMLGGIMKQFGGGSNAGLLAAGMALLQQQGGLEALVKKFTAGGLGDAVQSWVGTGDNAPVSAQQLESVLGKDAVAAAASQAGVTPEQASGGLASMLPELVNQLTPGGKIPENSGDLLSSVMGMLKK